MCFAQARRTMQVLAAVASLLLLMAGHALPERTNTAKQLVFCLNRHQPSKAHSTWDSVLSDDMTAAVPVAQAWWSHRPPAVPLTIITHLTLDRLDQLRSQCRSWKGPISAALYVTIDCSQATGSGANTTQKRTPRGQLRAAVRQAARLHSQAERMPCQLDLLLAYERFGGSNGTMLYPVNIMRNYARLQARTQLIGLFDADMLPSHTLFEELQDPENVERFMQLTRGSVGRSPALLVLPAFITYDTEGHVAEQIADSMVHTTKHVVAAMWRHEVIDRFDPTDKGHNATQYERWLTATEQYEVKFERRYEPWVICDRISVPWYDARFRGYGMNKIVHVEHMHQAGFRFVVHPTAWLVHRRHPLGESKLQHLRDYTELKHAGKSASQRYHTIYGHSSSLGHRIQGEIEHGHYFPVVDKGTRACAGRLPWWQQNHLLWQSKQFRHWLAQSQPAR